MIRVGSIRSQRVWVGPGFVTINGHEYHLDEPIEVLECLVYRAKNVASGERVGEWVRTHYRHLNWLYRLVYPRAPRPDHPLPPTKPLPEARALIKKGPR